MAKVCTKCGTNKPLSEYHTNLIKGKVYLRSYCKKCSSDLYKKYYSENKEMLYKRKKEWEKNNVDKKREYRRRERIKNTEGYRARGLMWYRKNVVWFDNKVYYKTNCPEYMRNLIELMHKAITANRVEKKIMEV